LCREVRPKSASRSEGARRHRVIDTPNQVAGGFYRGLRVVHCRTCGPPASSDYLHQHACAVVELSFTRHPPDEGWKTESDRTSPTLGR
jgi:hypothetical protein